MTVYKLFYFLFHAATALFAYLPLYYKETLLLDHHHVGLLMGIRPFCRVLGAPCLGTFADKFNKYKFTLYSGLLTYIVVYFSITFVSDVPENCGVVLTNLTNDTGRNISLGKRNEELLMIRRGNNVKESSAKLIRNIKIITADKRLKRSVKRFDHDTKMNIHIGEILSDGSNSQTSRGQTPVKEVVGQYRRFPFPKFKSSSAASPYQDSQEEKVSDTYSSFKQNEKSFSRNKMNVVVNPYQKQVLPSDLDYQSMKNTEKAEDEMAIFEPDFYDNLTEASTETDRWWENHPETAGENSWPVDVYGGETKGHGPPERKKSREHVFMILLLLTLAAELIGAPILSLADTATLQSLKKEPYRYGYQRVWASIGFGLMSIIAGSVLHYTITTKDEIKNCPEKMVNKYKPVFYSCCSLLLLAFFTSFKFRFRVYEGKDTSGCSFFRCLKYFKNVEYCLFAFLAWFTGLAGGLIDSFLFVHLIRLGATPLVMVVTTTVQSVSKVIFFCLSPMLLVNYGFFPVIYTGLLSSFITFLYYSFLEKPWMVVPIELLAGLSTSCVWAALASYVGAPPKIGATLQGILHAIHTGLGRGIGGLFGGMIIVNYGFDMLFRSFSLAIFLVVLITFLLRHWKNQDEEPIWSKLWDYSPIAPNDELSDDE